MTAVHLTVDTAAERIGVPRSRVARFIRRNPMPRGRRLDESDLPILALALGVDWPHDALPLHTLHDPAYAAYRAALRADRIDRLRVLLTRLDARPAR